MIANIAFVYFTQSVICMSESSEFRNTKHFCWNPGSGKRPGDPWNLVIGNSKHTPNPVLTLSVTH